MANGRGSTVKPWMIWGMVLLTLLSVWFSHSVYNDLLNLEATGGTWRARWIVVMVYEIFGKWGVVAILMGPSVVLWTALVADVRSGNHRTERQGKPLNAELLGRTIFDSVWIDKKYFAAAKEMIAPMNEVPDGTLLLELAFLRVAAAEYYLPGVGLDQHARDTAVGTFRACVSRKMSDITSDPRAMAMLYDRIREYIDAAQTAGKNDAEAIAEAFAAYCGKPRDTNLMQLGRNTFAGIGHRIRNLAGAPVIAQLYH